MEVNNKLIQDIAKLSKLKFDERSSEKMKADLEKILAFINKLNKIDTEGIEPLIYMSDETNVHSWLHKYLDDYSLGLSSLNLRDI